ncbi:hypothetical protein GCM10009850_038420 [Nonomuraea monospora]|uniref:HTH tetR-type domain-containing protein n=2 Tax=Nonomuraea monospora TaxID=568818 RepID=A0ABN3CGB7_9ACTN
MTARAEATARTRRRILQAAFDLSHEKMSLEIVLSDVAERAGVSVQTLLRHFGSRDGLFDALDQFARDEVTDERATPVGDAEAALDVIVEHYERRGDMVLRLLAQEFSDERARAISERGRLSHRKWVEQVFAPQLEPHPVDAHDMLTDLLVVATDIYTWKLLRRDQGLERDVARMRVMYLIGAILASAPKGQ